VLKCNTSLVNVGVFVKNEAYIDIDCYRLNWLSKSLITILAITSTVLW